MKPLEQEIEESLKDYNKRMDEGQYLKAFIFAPVVIPMWVGLANIAAILFFCYEAMFK